MGAIEKTAVTERKQWLSVDSWAVLLALAAALLIRSGVVKNIPW